MYTKAAQKQFQRFILEFSKAYYALITVMFKGLTPFQNVTNPVLYSHMTLILLFSQYPCLYHF